MIDINIEHIDITFIALLLLSGGDVGSGIGLLFPIQLTVKLADEGNLY